MAKDYDTAGKQLFDRHPRDWLALLGWPLPPTAAGVSVVDGDVSTVSRAADKLVRVEGVPVPYVAHVEFQTSGDRHLDGRMLEYNVLARGRHGLPVRSVAILFRPAAGSGPTGRVDESLDEQSRLLFAYRPVRLWEVPTAALLDGPLGTVPLAPLTAPLTATTSDVADLIRRTRARVIADAPPGAVDVMLECTRLLIGLRFAPGEREPLMPSLQKLIEEESWVYHDTIQKGREIGNAEGRHEQLLEMGIGKLGPADPATVARLMAVADVDELRRLGRRLLTVTTWADLFAAD